MSTFSPARTPEGEQALRSISCSPVWRAIDDGPEDARRWLGPQVVDALPLALRQAEAVLAPATMGDARRYLAPTLALVAPAGMSAADQTAWTVSALEALSGIPADLLERGCLEARRKVTHPSHIVATIHDEIDQAWRSRRRDLGRAKELTRLAESIRSGSAVSAPPREFNPDDRCSPEDAARIIDEFKLRRTEDPQTVRVRHDTPPRRPTDADYAALMGITVEEFHRRRDATRAELEEAEARHVAEVQAQADAIAQELAA